MQYLICYDISENKVRNKVMKYLEGFAWRIQYSVFSCETTEQRMVFIKQKLLELTAASEKCMLLITPMCHACQGKVWSKGEPLESAPRLIVV
ncbi:MAG: CRISPR-associated endonuclease Cas2 [Selenomonadaceae bacterium]|nr:CRISPR-associated endonuclease Cas2 [Selenomonadaceae bacterium]